MQRNATTLFNGRFASCWVRPLALPVLLLFATLAVEILPATAGEAVGFVFHDVNLNRRFDDGDAPLEGIKVSNGRDIVKTDAGGRYRLAIDDDCTIFVLKPRDWRTPLSSDNLPQFYYVHKPHGSPPSTIPGVSPTGPLPKSIDFPLYPQPEPAKFRVILFGDPQVLDQREIDYMAHDVIESLIGTDAAFGISLGDIVQNDLTLFESVNATIGEIGVPWHNVIGNHDLNFDSPGDEHSDETFERVYGPTCYSFDYGNVHFVLLDDIDWKKSRWPDTGLRMRGDLSARQLLYLKNDLALIPHEQLVVLLMHVPLTGVHNREQLFRLIENRPRCISLAAHHHRHHQHFFGESDGWLGGEPHHHIVHGSLCGCLWQGLPDERGIPHAMMNDGTPNGYTYLAFDGADYQLDFVAAGRSPDYQLEIMAPDAVAADRTTATVVYANVFNGTERSRVDMRLAENQPWIAMTATAEPSPTYRRNLEFERAHPNETVKAMNGKAAESTHLWRANLPTELGVGSHRIEVRTVDMYGRTYTAFRVIRVTPAATPTSP